MKQEDIRVEVLLALQMALIRMVKPNLRGVTCSWDGACIYVKFIFDGMISDDDAELSEEVCSEVASHFNTRKVECILDSIPYPELINSEVLFEWVYRRWEG